MCRFVVPDSVITYTDSGVQRAGSQPECGYVNRTAVGVEGAKCLKLKAKVEGGGVPMRTPRNRYAYP